MSRRAGRVYDVTSIARGYADGEFVEGILAYLDDKGYDGDPQQVFMLDENVGIIRLYWFDNTVPMPADLSNLPKREMGRLTHNLLNAMSFEGYVLHQMYSGQFSMADGKGAIDDLRARYESIRNRIKKRKIVNE